VSKAFNIVHPLSDESGMSQRRRLSPALDATQNLLDARDLADMLVYIHTFSKQVSFYDFSLEVSNWSVFFENSPPFILARLGRLNTEGVTRDFQQYNQLVKTDPMPAHFQLLLDFTFRTTLLDVANVYTQTKSVGGFRTLLEQEISSREMTTAVRQFIGIANGSKHWLCGRPIDFNFLTEEDIWQLDITDLFAQTTPSVLGTKIGQKQQILIWQAGIERFFDYFSQVITRLSKAAEAHVSESLYPLEVAYKERHEPHLGLLFAFLELFKHLKGQLNELTARHLDFYFREVLKIKSRKAIPDAVHLVVEVQKHVQKQLLKKGINFRDGKDAKGQDILFSLDDDIIVNKAQIKSLKTLAVKDYPVKKRVPNPDKQTELVDKTFIYTEGVFIAPVANSMDGKGMDFKDPMTKNWATLGSHKSKLVSKLTDGNLEPENQPFGRMGFVIASSVLFLQEGKRKIVIDLIIREKLNDVNFETLMNKKPFKISLSGEKDWVVPKMYSVKFIEKKVFDTDGITEKRTDYTLEFTIELDATDAPIVHFNAENLKENYGTTQPLVKIEIDPNITTALPKTIDTEGGLKCCAERTIDASEREASAYHFLKDVKVIDTKITVQVVGIKKNIVVQNDENVQDVDGLIYPFGTRPEVPDFSVVNGNKAGTRDGSNFYIGSKEIFLKNWKSVNIDVNWKDKPGNFKEYYGAYLQRIAEKLGKNDFTNFGLKDEDFKVNIAYLSKGDWERTATDEPLFTKTPHNGFEQRFTLLPNNITPTNQHDLTLPLTALKANTRDGFVRLTLRDQDFLHKDYPFVLARQMMAFGRFPDDVNGAIYMVDDVPQVSGLRALSEEIRKLTEGATVLEDVPIAVRAFIDRVNVIIDEGLTIDTNTAEMKFGKIELKLKNKTGDIIVNDIKFFLVTVKAVIISAVLNADTHYEINTTNYENIRTQFINNVHITYINNIVSGIDEIIGIIQDTITTQAPSDKAFHKLKNLLDSDKIKAANTDETKAFGDKSITQKVDALAKFATSQTNFLNRQTVDGLNKRALIPNEPWTPIIKNISLDYAAEAGKEDITFIQLLPFEATFKQEEITDNSTLLPQLPDEGTLFIGFEQLEPSTNVQMLFQLAEATADTEGGRAEVKWHYLSKNNAWKPLRMGFEILEDATNGLTASGIIKMAMPEDIGDKDDKNVPITEMPSGQFWIKASSAANTRSVCETLGIFTQAVHATALITEGSDTGRLSQPIEPESVAKLAVADASIKQVTQPFESFGGQIEEVGNQFYLRVSERLRHKGRAITPFDYERLLLEAFPNIYKAKCIPHSLALPANTYKVDLQEAAGFVTVAVIPDLTRLKSGDLTEPRVALHVLDEITAYLKAHATSFVHLKVVNPRYEKTNIAFELKLKKGKDSKYYPRQLEAELRRFLAPWSVGDSDKLSFGQPIYYSDILTFIDQREYVDYIKCLTVEREEGAKPNCPPSVNDGQTGVSRHEKEEKTVVLRPLTPRSIFVAGNITITLLADTCD
jgi:hypothetical protein